MNPSHFYRLVQAHARIEQELAASRQILMAMLRDGRDQAAPPAEPLAPPPPPPRAGAVALAERALIEGDGPLHLSQLYDRVRDLGYDGDPAPLRAAVHNLQLRGAIVRVRRGVYLHASIQHAEGHP